MNKPDLPVKAVTPPVTPEVAAEIERRLDTAVMDEQRKAARPAAEVMRELRKRYSDPA